MSQNIHDGVVKRKQEKDACLHPAVFSDDEQLPHYMTYDPLPHYIFLCDVLDVLSHFFKINSEEGNCCDGF